MRVLSTPELLRAYAAHLMELALKATDAGQIRFAARLTYSAGKYLDEAESRIPRKTREEPRTERRKRWYRPCGGGSGAAKIKRKGAGN